MSISADILSRLEEHVVSKELIVSGDKLILGVSGGADSTALLYLISRLRYIYNLSILAVHVNHQLRAEASESDEQAVRALCLRLNIPLIVRKITLEPGGDLENRARAARFAIFESILVAYRFKKIVLGHHKWDQAETMLLNLIRGAGLSGLSGIKALQDKVCHPLLIFKPEELRAMLIEQGICWQEDASNSQSNFTRNRLRIGLIPQVERDFNPQFKEKLVEEAKIISEADAYIRVRAQRKYKKILLYASKERVFLSLPDILGAPNIEQFYLLRFAYQALCGVEQDFMSSHFKEIQGIMVSEGSKHISLPRKVFVKKQYQELIFSTVADDIRTQAAEELVIESERARAVHMDYRFNFKHLKVLPHNYQELDNNHAIIDSDKLRGEIVIRSRQDGDRFIPLGMKDFKKLKDFFIDEKVPKYDRDLIPIFRDGEKLFWICGHRIDDRVKVDEDTTRYLMIVAEALTSKPKRAASRIKRGLHEFDEL